MLIIISINIISIVYWFFCMLEEHLNSIDLPYKWLYMISQSMRKFLITM